MQVKALADRLHSDHGRIDVLVNDIWGAEVLKGGPAQWNTPIWELDLDDGLRLLRLAIDTHLITSHHLLPLLIAAPGGLRGRGDRRHHRVQRDALPHLGVLRPRQGGGEPARVLQGHELAPHGATALAITPGWLRSEMMLEAFGVSEENWRDAVGNSAPDGFRAVRIASLRRARGRGPGIRLRPTPGGTSSR